MSEPSENQKLQRALIRVFNSSGGVVGAGFLVAERHILTCAHVIGAASHAFSRWEDYPPAAPKTEVVLDFPFIAPFKKHKARITLWIPPQPVTTTWGGDMAGLELLDDPPVAARAVKVIRFENLWNRRIRAFGFPKDYPNGIWACGYALAEETTRWLQIEDDKSTGFFVSPGFSGTPVWDIKYSAVVGMVIAGEKNEERKVGFAIPADVLLDQWPDFLALHPGSTISEAGKQKVEVELVSSLQGLKGELLKAAVRQFIILLAALLKIDPSEIETLQVRFGSTILKFGLKTQYAVRLVQLYSHFDWLESSESVLGQIRYIRWIIGDPDLRAIDLSGVDLRHADLHGADLRNANFSGSSLIGSDLSGADLTGANLFQTDLSYANLDEANLTNVDLQNTKGRGAPDPEPVEPSFTEWLRDTLGDPVSNSVSPLMREHIRTILRLFAVSEEIPAGGFGPTGVDPAPMFYLDVDQVYIGNQSFRMVSLRSGEIIGLSALRNYIILKVIGDSMNLAGIEDDDYVLLAQQSVADHNDIVAVEIIGVDAYAQLKRFVKHKEEIVLQPESTNQIFQPFAFPLSTEKFQVHGVVLAVLKPLSDEITEQGPLLRLFPVSEKIPAGGFFSTGWGPIDFDPAPISFMGIDNVYIDGNPFRIKNVGSGKIIPPNAIGRLICRRVHGDSMNLAGIEDGDYVLLHPQSEADHNDIVAVEIIDEDSIAMLKRLVKRSGNIILQPESTNPYHHEMVFSASDQGFVIRGVVLAVLKPIEEY